ncbi:hypothetical protein BS47DRAFT_1338532 [Hydnum rufescens UP504]|uniref:Uncharacterized protein n=1 Tax=Hydnum rufescens UP504 TaxID=1448309 RepID=A0A9P6E0T9_9AGAM|nr:hypothetical protein BS47DRAFT_1338532 [Hydnum rufescens UP504]
MEEETQAKELVLEKAQSGPSSVLLCVMMVIRCSRHFHSEHAAEDHGKALKIAQDTIEGNFRNGRNKRRRGVDGHFLSIPPS